MATSDYLELIFDVFDERDQRASVRAALTVSQVVEEIIREFDGLDPQERERYALTVAGQERPLVARQSLAEQGVQAGERLIFGWVRTGQINNRRPLSLANATLEELSQGQLFPIRWQPALIGRPDSDPVHNELLVLSLEWLPGGRHVSRQHAQVTEKGGIFFLQGLSPQNPTYLNGRRLEPKTPVPLQNGDRIALGDSGIRLRFRQEG